MPSTSLAPARAIPAGISLCWFSREFRGRGIAGRTWLAAIIFFSGWLAAADTAARERTVRSDSGFC
jgi:hypothetical protein